MTDNITSDHTERLPLSFISIKKALKMMKGVGSNTFVKYKNNNHFKNVPKRLYKKGGGRFENSTQIITLGGAATLQHKGPFK